MFDTMNDHPHCIPNINCGSSFFFKIIFFLYIFLLIKIKQEFNAIFFVIFIVIYDLILLNLFVILIIEQYNDNLN